MKCAISQVNVLLYSKVTYTATYYKLNSSNSKMVATFRKVFDCNSLKEPWLHGAFFSIDCR